MHLMDKMMEFMMGRMSEQEKEEMMSKMMDKFLSTMSVEDKKAMMAEMMPKMMKGVSMMEMMPKMMMGMMGGGDGKSGMSGMMAKMMGGDGQSRSAMMPHMMVEMMPHCLGTMLPNMPKESRIDFIVKLVDVEMQKGCAGLTEDEKRDLMAKVLEKVKV
jgi:hypothetical protein